MKREAKEREDTHKFELAKKDAVKRKRREAYAEAAGLMTTRAVKTLTKMKAKNVVEEMRAGLTPISFFIKKPGPPPEVDSEPEEEPSPGKPGTPGSDTSRPGTPGSRPGSRPSSKRSTRSDDDNDALTPMKERLKKTPFYKFKERKLLKKQIDSMTNAESQAALDLAKKEEKERKKLKKLEKKAGADSA